MSASVEGLGPVLLVDLGALSFQRSADGSLITVAVGSRLLGVHHCPREHSDSLAAFEALETVSRDSWVDVDSSHGPGQVKARVAWLNPFTSAVSVGPSENGWVFTDHAPVELDEDCVVGLIRLDMFHSRVLSVAGRDLPQRLAATLEDVSQELALHP